jgi:PAS domain S-box-containing protein
VQQDQKGAPPREFAAAEAAAQTPEPSSSDEDIVGRPAHPSQTEMEIRNAQTAMMAAPHESILVDREGMILAISPSLAKRFGHVPGDLIGQDGFRLLDPALVKRWRPRFGDTLRAGRIVRWEQEIDGAIYAVAFLPTRTQDGEFNRAVVVATDITARRQADRLLREQNAQLAAQAQQLEEANIALKVLLERQGRDRRELESDILNNARLVIRPMLDRLKASAIDRRQADIVAQLEQALRAITSPFLSRLSTACADFTPREIEVANLIREGKAGKEIAAILGASETTVKFHRQNIRKKLGLENQKVNLRTYLLSLASA